jgi:hypothetical protein
MPNDIPATAQDFFFHFGKFGIDTLKRFRDLPSCFIEAAVHLCIEEAKLVED